MEKNQVSSLMRRNISTLGGSLLFVILAAVGSSALQAAGGGATFTLSELPWGGMILALLLLTALAAACREKWLFRFEKELIQRLRAEKDTGALCLEVVSRLMMAGAFYLFFYLLSGSHFDLFQIIFYLPVSFLAMSICSQIVISESTRKICVFVARAMLVAYCYCNLITHSYTRLTAGSQPVVLGITSQVTAWVRVVGVVLIIYQFRVDVRRAIATCLVTGLLLCTDQQGVPPLMLEFAGFLMLSNLMGKPKNTAKVLLAAMAVYAIVVPLGTLFGWTENIQMSFSYSQPRWAWGMNHTNLTALVVMTLLLLVWYVFLQERPLWALLIFEAATVGVWFGTYCRTVTMVLAIFPLLNYARIWLLKKNHEKVFALLPFVPLLFAALSMLALFLVPTLGNLGLDSNFLLRFQIPYQSMQTYGLHLFQPGVPFVDPVDNLFLHILTFWGILPAVVIPLLLTLAGWGFYKNKQYTELVLLTLMMIYSLTENALVRLPFGFVLVLSLPVGQEVWVPSFLRQSAEHLEIAREQTRQSIQSLTHEKKVPLSWRSRLALACAGYLALMGVMYWIVEKDWSETVISNDPVNQDTLLPEVDAEHEIRQTFELQSDRLNQIALYFDETALPEEEGQRGVTLSIQAGEQTLAEERILLKDLPPNGKLVWKPMEDLRLGMGRSLTICIQGEGGVRFWAGSTRSAGKYDVDAVTQERLTVGEENISGELVMEQLGVRFMPYTRWFWPVALGLGVLLLGLALYSHRRRVSGNLTSLNRAGDLVHQYYYLLKTLVIRDFKVRYKASVLGVIWSFLNPLLMTFVYLFVFSTLFRSSIPNFPVYLLSGIVLYNYFSEATNMGMQSIVGNAGLITKVYMPKYIFPISKALSSGINLVISLIPLLIMMAVTGVQFHKSLLLLPLLITYLVIFCVGVSLILSACMVYFRDIQFLWGIVLTILNFFSPIFYPESIIPAQFIQLYHLNPMYQYLFFMRTIVIGGISPTPITYVYCTLASLGALAVGLLVFRKSQSSFVLHL